MRVGPAAREFAQGHRTVNGPNGKFFTGAPAADTGKRHVNMARAVHAGIEVFMSLSGPVILG
jgi:hypothetical protein